MPGALPTLLLQLPRLVPSVPFLVLQWVLAEQAWILLPVLPFCLAKRWAGQRRCLQNSATCTGDLRLTVIETTAALVTGYFFHGRAERFGVRSTFVSPRGHGRIGGMVAAEQPGYRLFSGRTSSGGSGGFGWAVGRQASALLQDGGTPAERSWLLLTIPSPGTRGFSLPASAPATLHLYHLGLPSLHLRLNLLTK